MRFDEERLIAHKEIASPGRELQAPELGLLQADLPTPRAVIEALLRSRGALILPNSVIWRSPFFAEGFLAGMVEKLNINLCLVISVGSGVGGGQGMPGE